MVSDILRKFCFVLKVKVQHSKMNKEMKCSEGSQAQTSTGSGVWKAALDNFMTIYNICSPAGQTKAEVIRKPGAPGQMTARQKSEPEGVGAKAGPCLKGLYPITAKGCPGLASVGRFYLTKEAVGVAWIWI